METTNLDRIRKILYTDKVWSVYALADTQIPVFRPHCRWFVSEAGEEDAAVLLFGAFDIPVMVAVGPDSTVSRILHEIELPPQLFLMVKESHYALLKRWYSFSEGIDPMVRMFLADEALLSAVGQKPSSASLRRLTVAHEQQIRALFGHGGPHAPGDFFSAFQIENGPFYGAFSQEEELIAVGGTHVVDREDECAAVGNMYTHPQWRNQGFATSILSAIVADLRRENIDTIVLNVDQRNQRARTIYEQCGFGHHCPYVEGVGTLTTNK
ncbi:MAG: GNAT family N-acetyltransferase [Chloroflexota bacterium]